MLTDDKEIRKKISFHFNRAKKAYDLYLVEKKYLQALRIYKANKTVYELINHNAHLFTGNNETFLIQYLFHLEDWFGQFTVIRKERKPALDDDFHFSRIDFALPFPKAIDEIFARFSED